MALALLVGSVLLVTVVVGPVGGTAAVPTDECGGVVDATLAGGERCTNDSEVVEVSVLSNASAADDDDGADVDVASNESASSDDDTADVDVASDGAQGNDTTSVDVVSDEHVVRVCLLGRGVNTSGRVNCRVDGSNSGGDGSNGGDDGPGDGGPGDGGSDDDGSDDGGPDGGGDGPGDGGSDDGDGSGGDGDGSNGGDGPDGDEGSDGTPGEDEDSDGDGVPDTDEGDDAVDDPDADATPSPTLSQPTVTAAGTPVPTNASVGGDGGGGLTVGSLFGDLLDAVPAPPVDVPPHVGSQLGPITPNAIVQALAVAVILTTGHVLVPNVPIE